MTTKCECQVCIANKYITENYGNEFGDWYSDFTLDKEMEHYRNKNFNGNTDYLYTKDYIDKLYKGFK